MTHPNRVLNLDMKAKPLYAKELYLTADIYIYIYIYIYELLAIFSTILAMNTAFLQLLFFY